MGTRGLWGFHYKKKDKLTYNHYDSYPTGLGQIIKEFISSHSIKELEKMATKIKLVEGDSVPTPTQIKECKKFANLSVGSQNIADWYCLLRETQGIPNAYVTKLQYMIDGKYFIKDSLFCEYAYIINLDTKQLEIYLGFQNRQQNNRYKLTKKEIQEEKEKKKNSKLTPYYNCKLHIEIPLKKVSSFDMEKFEEELRED